MKVIFMGTPEFSCPTLQALINDPEIEVVAAYSREPQKKGRGHKVTNSPIHNLALSHNIKVITPKTLKNEAIQKEFLDFKADAAIVVAYGLILPKAILEGTKYGCINIHPSLLPKWRGAAPIQRTIINADQETGVTIIKMNEGVDSGDIIYQNKFALDDKITYNQLAEKFANQGAKILLQTLKNIKIGNYKLTKQDDSKASYAHKISKEESKIDWNLTAQQINNQIRGLSGNIGCYFEYNGQRIKILKAEILEKHSTSPVGTIIDNHLTIACKEGCIKPLILQRPGKKAMVIDEFLRGFDTITKNQLNA